MGKSDRFSNLNKKIDCFEWKLKKIKQAEFQIQVDLLILKNLGDSKISIKLSKSINYQQYVQWIIKKKRDQDRYKSTRVK